MFLGLNEMLIQYFGQNKTVLLFQGLLLLGWCFVAADLRQHTEQNCPLQFTCK